MEYKRKFIYGILATSILTACASAPKPPECKGEFKPVNPLEQKSTSTANSGRLISCNEGVTHG